MGKVIKPNWDNFKVKFSDNPQKNFEWFCYLLFCKKYNQPEGIFRYKNQVAIETKEIEIDGEFIGFQAKFYTDKLSNHKKDLIDTMVDAKKYYKNINKIVFYTNQEWGQGKDGQDSSCKKEIELTGKKLNISIEWKTKSFFESEFVAIQNSDISSHFFCLEDSMIDKLNKIIIPRINELNSEYKETFNPINNEFINRKEVKVCIENLKQGKSIIIHGKAGQGKSGCTQGIISYCEDNKVPYLAIKLDYKMPVDNADKWGKDLGLAMSIDKAFDMFSYDTSGVIILDQLDALRWTQTHSRQALNVCSEIIRRINVINKNIKKKISIIFVCRTYDYENDNSIRLLFKEDKNNKEDKIEWVEVEVKSLDENVVKSIVGYRYENLSKKMKQLLSVPSNLYIWSQLKEKMYDDYSTTNQLIQSWWKQLKENCEKNGIHDGEIEKLKSEMIDKIEKKGKLYINVKVIDATEKSLAYLKSCGFLVQVNNNISFSHQSISDYFSAQMMLKRYDDGENIIDIIGDKQKQTPQRRYQVQILLQDIQESYEECFIDIGIRMLNSDKVRFYMKYVFLEVLGQSTTVIPSAEDFLIKYCKDDTFGKHILDTVVSGHSIFIDILIEKGILDAWMQLDSMKDIAINLIISISPNYNYKEFKFIEKYMFKSEEDDNKLYNCFDLDIHEDTDDIFDLRLKFYERYPDKIYYRLNFQKLFLKCDIRTIQIFEILLKNDKEEKYNYWYNDKFFFENIEIFPENVDSVLDKLLPYIPKNEDHFSQSQWIYNRYFNTIQRFCIEIIHRANRVMIYENPENFIKKYKNYIVKNNFIYNEIILLGFKELPVDFSTYVISCIVKYFDTIIFDISSPSENELDLTKEILEKHTENCSEDIFRKLEEKIIYYIDPKAKEIYNSRKKDEEIQNFWGDLQIELLPYLDKKRISKKSEDLLKVLNRKGCKNSGRYNKLSNNEILDEILAESEFSDAYSPISGKKLNNKQWKNILENKKINNNSKKIKWLKDKKCYVESYIEDFAKDFSKAVSSEPNRFANLLLKVNKQISNIYIDSLFNAIAYSNNLNEVSNCTIEKLILRYGYNYTSYRAKYICCILSKKEDTNWSKYILNILCDIAVNHNDPKKCTQITPFEKLYKYSYSSVRGSAIITIGDLLRKDINLFNYFKQIIEILCNDINPIVRLATIYILYPVYNINREFVRKNVISILEKDYRAIGYPGMESMCFLLYEDSKEYIDKALLKCYSSKDKSLIGTASFIISEIYIIYGRYENIINSKNINMIQAQNIVEMAIRYINKKEYSKVAKELIKKILDLNIDIENVLSKIFYDNLVDLKRDKTFIIDVVKSHMGRKIVHSFAKYVEENALNIIEYSDIILNLSFNIVSDYPRTEENGKVLDNELSTLIIRLYDQCYQSKDKNLREVAYKCLEIWDLMFEKRIGMARILTQHMLDR